MSASLRSRALLPFLLPPLARRCSLAGLERWRSSSGGDRTFSSRSLESASRWILDRTWPLCHKLNCLALDVEDTIAAASSSSTPLPVPWGEFEYWESCLPGQYSALYRRRLTSDAAEASGSRKGLDQRVEKVVDCNALIADRGDQSGGYVNLEAIRMSPDHTHAAYIADTTGRDEYTLFINDCSTGRMFKEATTENVTQMEWIDNDSYVYTKTDHAGRPNLVYYTSLPRQADGVLPTTAVDCLPRVVFNELRTAFCVDLNRTKDGEFIVIVSKSSASSTTYLLWMENGEPMLKQFIDDAEQEQQQQVFVESLGRYYYCLYRSALSSDLEIRRALKSQRLPLRPSQMEVVKFDADSDERRIMDISVLSSGLVVQCQSPFSTTLHFIHTADDEIVGASEIRLPQDVLETVSSDPNHQRNANRLDGVSITPLMNCDLESKSFYAMVSSASTPGIPIEWNIQENRCNAMEANSPSFEGVSRRHCYYSARDGSSVPISILLPSDPSQRVGRVLVQAYGAYGVSDPHDFSALTHSFVRGTGWAFATAHVRGSGQRGRKWHIAGRGQHKHVSGHDLADCVHYLIGQGYARDGLVSLLASSAGGIPAAQTIYEIPHLIASAALRSPLVDVHDAYVQGSLLLGEHERAEWGPSELDESEYLACLRSICPTSAIPTESIRLPAMIVSTYTNDTRVRCSGVLKWASKLGQLQSDPDRPILALLDSQPIDSARSGEESTGAGFGHMGRGGSPGLWDSCQELAFVASFGYT